jgi:protein phosphatase 1 regulatory subunit 37
MAAPPSPVPSSSAVTIPIPGKSILKRPQQSQQSFFSRIKGFLPTQSANTSNDTKPLKRAHFILPQIATVYPISSINPPSTPSLKEEKKAIEDREAERRKRVVRGNSDGPGANETEDWWNLDKVESFYRECCASREEPPDHAITVAFKVWRNIDPGVQSYTQKSTACFSLKSSRCGFFWRTVDVHICSHFV